MLEKYKKLPVQAKASAWYTICNFFQNGISFLVVPLYIRLLSTDEYGRWSVFQSWRDILIIFASLNLYAGIYTKTLVDNKFDRDKYTSSMQGLGTVCTIILFVLYSLFHSKIDKTLGLSLPYILILFIYFAVYPGFLFWMTRKRVEYKYISVVVVTAIVSIGIPLLSILFLFTLGRKAEALILGFLIMQCIIGFVLYIKQFIKCHSFFDLSFWKYALEYNLPLIPHYLSLIILNQSDRIMIKNYCGDGDAGRYSLAYQLAIVITILATSINGSRVPWTYEKLKTGRYDNLKKIICYLVIFLSCVTVILGLFSPEIIGVIGTDEYKTATYVIPVVSLGLFYSFIYDLFAAIEFYFGYTKYVMYASTVGAVLNLLLNMVFIPKYGFVAAAYTTLICYAVLMLMHFAFYRRIIHIQKISEDIYNDKIIFAITGITTILVFFILLSYGNSILRISIAILFICSFILLRKRFVKLIKGIFDIRS